MSWRQNDDAAMHSVVRAVVPHGDGFLVFAGNGEVHYFDPASDAYDERAPVPGSWRDADLAKGRAEATRKREREAQAQRSNEAEARRNAAVATLRTEFPSAVAFSPMGHAQSVAIDNLKKLPGWGALPGPARASLSGVVRQGLARVGSGSIYPPSTRTELLASVTEVIRAIEATATRLAEKIAEKGYDIAPPPAASLVVSLSKLRAELARLAASTPQEPTRDHAASSCGPSPSALLARLATR